MGPRRRLRKPSKDSWLPLSKPGLTWRQRWNRVKWNFTTAIPIILDSNDFSIACYMLDMEERLGEGWDDDHWGSAS